MGGFDRDVNRFGRVNLELHVVVTAGFPFLPHFSTRFSLRKKTWSKFTEFPTHKAADLQYILGAPKIRLSC